MVGADDLAAWSTVHSDFARACSIVELTDAVITRAMSVAETHALRDYKAARLAWQRLWKFMRFVRAAGCRRSFLCWLMMN
jgi:hypothetical protein